MRLGKVLYCRGYLFQALTFIQRSHRGQYFLVADCLALSNAKDTATGKRGRTGMG